MLSINTDPASPPDPPSPPNNCTNTTNKFNIVCLDNSKPLSGLAICLVISYTVLLALTIRNWTQFQLRARVVGRRMRLAQFQMVSIELGRILFFFQFIVILFLDGN